MNDDLTPIEEQALDALLVETLTGAGPPDLSGQILARLREAPLHVGSIVPAEKPKRESHSSATRRQIAIALTFVATIAASMLFVIWLRSDRQFLGPSQSIAVAPHASTVPGVSGPIVDPTSLDPASPPMDTSEPKLADTPPRNPPRGIPLVIGSSPPGDEPPTGPLQPIDLESAPASSARLEAVALVSTQVDSELRAYWDAIGIEPSSDEVADAVVERLRVVLAAELAADSLDDPQQLQLDLATPVVARAIATSWLRQITEGGVSRLDQEARDALIEELAACFRAERAFDRTLTGWIGGQSPSASGFYQAVSSGAKYSNGSSAMLRRLAALTMNVDLRCTRCHESYAEHNGLQEDYWAFNAFLRLGVKRGPEGQLTIDETANKTAPLFYEVPDGRQAIAEPAIPSKWLKTPSDQAIFGVGDWAQRLNGSPELARGAVNSLWQLVHGQPLRGRVIDPISAPHNESLDRLEEELVQDLMGSHFDVARTLALIIASPATGRAVPAPLLPANSLVADESEVLAAQDAVNAFAAAMPPPTRLPLRRRLDVAMRAIGAKLSVDEQPLLAQAAPGTKKSDKPDEDRAPAADFPDRGDSYPVQWLTQIEDPTNRVEHLAYLAGFSQIPDGILEAAEQTRAANVSEGLTLRRVWWLLRQ